MCIAVLLGVADNDLYWGILHVKVAISQTVAVTVCQTGYFPDKVGSSCRAYWFIFFIIIPSFESGNTVEAVPNP